METNTLTTTDDRLRDALYRLRWADDNGLRLWRRKQAADLLVSLRAQILRPSDGRPDATGQTHEYRMRVSEAFREAGYSREEATREQAALRHHVSTAARAYFTDIEEYGVLPYDRNEYKRNERTKASAA